MTDNEILTKDPDRRSQCACGLVTLRMQPTGVDNQCAINEPGHDCPTDGPDDVTDSDQQSTGPRNGTISHQQRAGLHDGCVTAAGDHDADFHKSVADDRTPACHAIIAWEHGAGECHRPGCRSGPRQPPGIGPTATGWGKHPIVPRTVFVVIIFNETQAFPCK
jgi:hypothetical protein